MRLEEGLVFLSDSRTNAGVDQINTFRKMTVLERPGERVLVLMSAGNLALTQAVRQRLIEREADDEAAIWRAPSLAEAARQVGDAVRDIHARDANTLREFNIEFNCSFLLGGQIAGEPCRLFMIYSAGNFIETSAENPYFQIGESKYGKPILDRVITPATPLDEAAKCALISMDSTLRSNLSVGLPLDLLCYQADSLHVTRFALIDEHNRYFQMIRSSWGERLREVFAEIPAPAWESDDSADSLMQREAPPARPNIASPTGAKRPSGGRRNLQTVAGIPDAGDLKPR
jgi:putative proteasome-type protease